MPHYDIIIIGSGPIAAATAYALAKNPHGSSVGLVTEETGEGAPPRTATYRFSGGSVRMWWTDQAMAEMTAQTASLIEELSESGVDIGAVRDRYVMVHRGLEVPSWNVTAVKLVAYFLSVAQRGGATVHQNTKLLSLQQSGGACIAKTSQGEFSAGKVLLAVGSQIKNFLPDCPFEYKKRALLVFDSPIISEREHFPHTVVPLGNGLVFGFVKTIGGQKKFVLGQEDLYEFNSEWSEENFLKHLVDSGLYDLMPFLKDAHVEQVLWGFDSAKKYPEFYVSGNILAVTCGSAVRSSAWIGEETAKKLLQ